MIHPVVVDIICTVVVVIDIMIRIVVVKKFCDVAGISRVVIVVGTGV